MKYLKPELEMIEIEMVDVIRTSGEGNGNVGETTKPGNENQSPEIGF